LRLKIKKLKSYKSTTAPKTLSSTLKKLSLYGISLGIVFGVVYFAPASWLGLYLEHLSGGKLSLIQTSGSVWAGSGELLVRTSKRDEESSFGGLGSTESSQTRLSNLGKSKSVDPELLIASPFNWQVSLGLALDRSLFTPQLRFSIDNACCLVKPLLITFEPWWVQSGQEEQTQMMQVTQPSPTPQSLPSNGLVLNLSDTQSSWPAQWLSGLGAPWNTVAPKGVLIVKTEHAAVVLHPLSGGTPRLRGGAQIIFQDLSSQLSTLEPLGTYVVKLSEPLPETGQLGGAGSSGGVTLHLSLETLDGRLELTGEGDWVNQHLYFNGLAKAQVGFEAALANLLSVLGPRHDNTATLKIG